MTIEGGHPLLVAPETAELFPPHAGLRHVGGKRAIPREDEESTRDALSSPPPAVHSEGDSVAVSHEASTPASVADRPAAETSVEVHIPTAVRALFARKIADRETDSSSSAARRAAVDALLGNTATAVPTAEQNPSATPVLGGASTASVSTPSAGADSAAAEVVADPANARSPTSVTAADGKSAPPAMDLAAQKFTKAKPPAMNLAAQKLAEAEPPAVDSAAQRSATVVPPAMDSATQQPTVEPPAVDSSVLRKLMRPVVHPFIDADSVEASRSEREEQKPATFTPDSSDKSVPIDPPPSAPADAPAAHSAPDLATPPAPKGDMDVDNDIQPLPYALEGVFKLGKWQQLGHDGRQRFIDGQAKIASNVQQRAETAFANSLNLQVEGSTAAATTAVHQST